MAEVKFISVYIGPKKCGECEQLKMSVMSNGEQLISADEVVESTGVVTVDATLDTIVKFGSHSVDLMDYVINQKPLSLGTAPFNGKVYKSDGKMIKSEITSTSKSGVSKGNFQFRGGPLKAI